MIDRYIDAADHPGGKLFFVDMAEQRLQALLGRVRLPMLHGSLDLLKHLNDFRHGLLINGWNIRVADGRLLRMGVVCELSGLLGLLRRAGQF